MRPQRRLFLTYLILPLIVLVSTWAANAKMNKQVNDLLVSLNIPIKYAGTLVYALFLMFETGDVIKKWWGLPDGYWRLESWKIEMRNDIRNFLIKLLITIVLFATAYFFFNS